MAYHDDHVADNVRRWWYLVSIAIPGGTWYLTDCDVPIAFGGHTYLPSYGVAVGGVGGSSDKPGDASVVIQNGDAAFGALIAALSVDSAHPAVVITEVWMDPTDATLAIQSTRVVASGILDLPEWDSQAVRFRVPPAVDAETMGLPARLAGPTCAWRQFKGPECQYAGGVTSCDRSLTTCTSLSNKVHFGGFPRVPWLGWPITFGNTEIIPED